ncbi:GNAT family N-acetyltransferase [Lentzea flava]|uniref:GNAT family N-acetyltransferase n=1 Tax=Lentzea flava TaxID=103732 RepID=UPI001E35C620|nr:GNAT family N-acetyltransferase [Lentzea flava]
MSLLGAPGRPAVTGGQVAVRDYETADEASWLRCRVLAFLATSSYDDVWPVKRRTDLELVAAGGDGVVGVLDVSVPGEGAVVETVAVHPDHQRRGVATALLGEAVRRLARCGVRTLEVSVREDEPVLSWLARNGFVETSRSLHVYASEDEVGTVVSARYGLTPVGAFLHARIERETELRQRFERVHVCRGMVRGLV